MYIYIMVRKKRKKAVALYEKYKYIVFYVIHIILMDISCTFWYVYSIIYSSSILQNKRCRYIYILLYDIFYLREFIWCSFRDVRFRTDDIIWSIYASHSTFFVNLVRSHHSRPAFYTAIYLILDCSQTSLWWNTPFIIIKHCRRKYILSIR